MKNSIKTDLTNLRFKESLILYFLVGSLPAAGTEQSTSENCFNYLAHGNSYELYDKVAEQFKITHGINLDWTEALEVSDDEEGNNCNFSLGDGRSITLPIEYARFTAPNKWFNR